mgnify:CR=1 FL=1
MAAGNVEVVWFRLFYERAAMQLGAGASCGNVLVLMRNLPSGRRRLQPDAAAAKRWYERACELGADEGPMSRLQLSAAPIL